MVLDSGFKMSISRISICVLLLFLVTGLLFYFTSGAHIKADHSAKFVEHYELGKKRKFYVTSKNLSVGHTVTDADFVEIPHAAKTSDEIEDPSAILGRTLVFNKKKGELFRLEDFDRSLPDDILAKKYNVEATQVIDVNQKISSSMLRVIDNELPGYGPAVIESLVGAKAGVYLEKGQPVSKEFLESAEYLK